MHSPSADLQVDDEEGQPVGGLLADSGQTSQLTYEPCNGVLIGHDRSWVQVLGGKTGAPRRFASEQNNSHYKNKKKMQE